MKETYSALLNTYSTDKYNLVFDVKDGNMTLEDFKDDVRAFCAKYYPSEEDVESVLEQVIENLFGYSKITALIKNEEITDIKIHDWNRIIVTKNGKRELADVSFDDVNEYNRFIESVITKNKINASTVNAIRRFTDDDSFDDWILRFTLITPYINSRKKHELVIRKVRKDFYETEDLVREGMMTDEMRKYLEDAWNRGSILVCGANSSGKTTLLNALKEKIPHNKSVLIIQQAQELTTKSHPDMMFLMSHEGKGEVDATYDLKDLSIAGLTLDIDVFIIGEIKGDEASYFLNASYTGHISGGTVHSGSAQTAIDKIIDYSLYSSSYTKPELMEMMTTVKTVVHMKDFKVNEIVEVLGCKDGHMEYKEVYNREKGIEFNS